MKTPGSPEEARAQFVAWVRDRHPTLYVAATRAAEDDQIDGLGSAATSMGPPEIGPASTGNALFDRIAKMGDQYLSLQSQKALFDQNLRAVRAGKSPKRTAAPAPVIAPPTYGESLMDRINAIPLPVKLIALGGLAALLYFKPWKR